MLLFEFGCQILIHFEHFYMALKQEATGKFCLFLKWYCARHSYVYTPLLTVRWLLSFNRTCHNRNTSDTQHIYMYIVYI